MMWTKPNEENNFSITAKCRIGHKNDVLAIDNSQQFIVSGGVDGLASVWNLFSGILKYAVALPPPSTISDPFQSSQTFQKVNDNSLISDLDEDADLDDKDPSLNDFCPSPSKSIKSKASFLSKSKQNDMNVAKG